MGEKDVLVTISIPEEFVMDFTNDGFQEFFNRVIVDLETCHTLVGNYEFETLDMFKEAFKKAYDTITDATNPTKNCKATICRCKEW